MEGTGSMCLKVLRRFTNISTITRFEIKQLDLSGVASRVVARAMQEASSHKQHIWQGKEGKTLINCRGSREVGLYTTVANTNPSRNHHVYLGR